MRRDLCLVLLIVLMVSLVSVEVLAQDAFVQLREFTRSGEVIKLDEEMAWLDVDINSSIRINFAPINLQGSGVDTLSTEKMNQLREEVRELNKLLKTGREDLDQYISQINNMKEKLLEKYDPKLEAKYREMLRKHGSFINQILSSLMEVVPRERLNQALSKGDPLYRDLLELLAEHTANKKSKLNKQIQKSIQKRKLTLKVWCIHYSGGVKPSAVHMPHYDNLESGQFNKVDKMTMALSDAEMEKVRGDIQLYRKLEGLAGDIGDKKGKMTDLLADLKKRLRSKLVKIESPPLETFQKVLAKLEEGLTEMAEDDQNQKLLKTVKEIRVELKEYSNLEDKYKSLIDNLSKDKLTPEEIFDTIHKTKKLISSFKKDIIKGDLLSQLEQVLEELEADYSDRLKSEITRLEKSVPDLKRSVNKVSQILSDHLDGFQGLAQRLIFSSTISQKTDSKEPKEFELPEENLNQVSLADAPPTVLDLTRTRRHEGDHYTLHVQVESKEKVEFKREYTFRVKEFGTSSTWLKNMNFVKQSNQHIFHPATSISWIIHYKGRDQDSWIEKLNQTLTPGLGLNSIVYSEEGNIKYGLGVTLSLFEDNLQLGGGFSLQEEDSQGYFFIGSSLLDIFKNIN